MKASLIAALVVACPPLLSACADGTAPRETVIAITLTELLGPTTGVDANGQPTVSCEIELRAVGAGQGQATWVGATLRTFTVGDPSTRAEVTTIGADIVREVWGSDVIAAGETQTSRWLALKAAPFSATLDFSYRSASGGPLRGAGVAFICQP